MGNETGATARWPACLPASGPMKLRRPALPSVRPALARPLATAALAALVAVGATIGAGCDGQRLQESFAAAARRSPSGITRTNAQGAVAETDADDWRTAPVYAGRVRVDPAFPNPAAQGRFVSVSVGVLDFEGTQGGLSLHAYDPGGRLRVLTTQRVDGPGTYVLSFGASQLGRVGLTRVFVLDGRGEIISYGDVEVLG